MNESALFVGIGVVWLMGIVVAGLSLTPAWWEIVLIVFFPAGLWLTVRPSGHETAGWILLWAGAAGMIVFAWRRRRFDPEWPKSHPDGTRTSWLGGGGRGSTLYGRVEAAVPGRWFIYVFSGKALGYPLDALWGALVRVPAPASWNGLVVYATPGVDLSGSAKLAALAPEERVFRLSHGVVESSLYSQYTDRRLEEQMSGRLLRIKAALEEVASSSASAAKS